VLCIAAGVTLYLLRLPTRSLEDTAGEDDHQG
jgi:hypothetical protein